MDAKDREKLRVEIANAMKGGSYKFDTIRLSCLDAVLAAVEKFIDEKKIKNTK